MAAFCAETAEVAKTNDKAMRVFLGIKHEGYSIKLRAKVEL